MCARCFTPNCVFAGSNQRACRAAAVVCRATGSNSKIVFAGPTHLLPCLPPRSLTCPTAPLTCPTLSPAPLVTAAYLPLPVLCGQASDTFTANVAIDEVPREPEGGEDAGAPIPEAAAKVGRLS